MVDIKILKKVGNVNTFTLTSKHSDLFQAVTNKGREKARVWKVIDTFKNADEAKESVMQDEWCLDYSGKNKDGSYKVYRCNKSKQIIRKK